MESQILRILLAIAVIWLTQVLLDALEIKQPAHKIVFVVVIILTIVWLVTGSFQLNLNF